MEAEPSEAKRKRSAAEDFESEVAGTLKTPDKLSEKKRRRSHMAEGSESEVPSKMRKTSESEGEKEKDVTKTSKLSQYLLVHQDTILSFYPFHSLCFLLSQSKKKMKCNDEYVQQ